MARRGTTEQIADVLGAGHEDAAAFLSLLIAAHAVFPCDADGHIAEDHNVPLRQWEFHDLLFHTRSRLGRHDAGSGGTFRFAETLLPPPAIKPPMSDRGIPLYTPDMTALGRHDPPFSRVLESRRSIRTAAERPISDAQLGEFLYRVARVQAVQPSDPNDRRSYETSLRPCASGGAGHEIELYLTVRRCDGMEPGCITIRRSRTNSNI